MATIKVGQQYAQEFNSIVKLKQDGFLSKNINIRQAEAGRIVTDAHTFLLDTGNDNSSQQSSFIGFTKTGASWFANVRGEETQDNNSEWQMLIEAVADDYHRNYSFLEFRQVKTPSQQRREMALAEKLHNELLVQLLDKVALSAPILVGDDPMDIYGVSMKLDVSGGVGQAEPILCKMYFRKQRGEILPLPMEQAEDIERFIKSSVPADVEDINATLDDEYGRIIDEVFVALTNCIEDKPGVADNDFTDYVLFSEYDQETLQRMLDTLANSDEKNLTCTNVQILGISHVEWKNSLFKVRQGDKDVLGVTIGLNDSIDVRCLNCQDDSILIEANTIKITTGYGKYKKQEIIKLNPSKEDFGLTEQQLTDIKELSAFARHLFMVDCSQFTDNDCRRVVCASQAFDADGTMRCKNCHHPEVVYVDIFDETALPKTTSSLAFAYDKLALIEQTDQDGKPRLFTCPCCQKTYSTDTKQYDGLCEHCAAPDDSAEGKRKYKQYRKMLDPFTRFIHLKDKKTCKEYRTMIIFTVGKHRYVFDQINVDDKKLISGPTKHPRRK